MPQRVRHLRAGKAGTAVFVLACSAALGLGIAPAASTGAAAAGFAAMPGGGWVIAYPDGLVETGGGATHQGDMSDLAINRPIVGASATPTGNGYWLVADDGGIFSFGDARFYGSTGSLALNRPVVAMAPTPTGNGYWLVADDGGIFSFGDARFYGSTGSLALNRPVVAMAPTRTGNGYWLVADDGGIFSFGDARFYGSTGSLDVGRPVVGMLTSPGGAGYWLATDDGNVYAFGDAEYYGEPAGFTYGATIGIAPRADGIGYVVVDTNGHHVYGPGVASHLSGSASGSTEAIAADIVARANDERAARGIPPLSVSAWLVEDAIAAAHHMADVDRLEHLTDLTVIMTAHEATAAGENIGVTTLPDVAAHLHWMWMNAPSHRQNMLDPGFDTIGVGVVCRGSTAYSSMLLLRSSGFAPLTREPPPVEPIVRADSDPVVGIGCA